MATLENTSREGLARFASATSRVDKPWGYEHIYAVTPEYCGKGRSICAIVPEKFE